MSYGSALWLVLVQRHWRAKWRAKLDKRAVAVPVVNVPTIDTAVRPRRLRKVALEGEERAQLLGRLHSVASEFGGLERLILLVNELAPLELAEVSATLFRDDLRDLARDMVARQRRSELNEATDWEEAWKWVSPRVQTFLLHGFSLQIEHDAQSNRSATALRRAFTGRLSLLFDMLHLTQPKANQPKHVALSTVSPRVPKSTLIEILAGLNHSDSAEVGRKRRTLGAAQARATHSPPCAASAVLMRVRTVPLSQRHPHCATQVSPARTAAIIEVVGDERALLVAVDNCDLPDLHFINKVLFLLLKPSDFNEQMALHGLAMRDIRSLDSGDLIDLSDAEHAAFSGFEGYIMETALNESQHMHGWSAKVETEQLKLAAQDGSFAPAFQRRNLGKQLHRKYERIVGTNGRVELHYASTPTNAGAATPKEGDVVTTLVPWQVGTPLELMAAGTAVQILGVLDGAMVVRSETTGGVGVVPAHVVVSGAPAVSAKQWASMESGSTMPKVDDAAARLERMWAAPNQRPTASSSYDASAFSSATNATTTSSIPAAASTPPSAAARTAEAAAAAKAKAKAKAEAEAAAATSQELVAWLLLAGASRPEPAGTEVVLHDAYPEWGRAVVQPLERSGEVVNVLCIEGRLAPGPFGCGNLLQWRKVSGGGDKSLLLDRLDGPVFGPNAPCFLVFSTPQLAASEHQHAFIFESSVARDHAVRMLEGAADSGVADGKETEAATATPTSANPAAASTSAPDDSGFATASHNGRQSHKWSNNSCYMDSSMEVFAAPQRWLLHLRGGASDATAPPLLPMPPPRTFNAYPYDEKNMDGRFEVHVSLDTSLAAWWGAKQLIYHAAAPVEAGEIARLSELRDRVRRDYELGCLKARTERELEIELHRGMTTFGSAHGALVVLLGAAGQHFLRVTTTPTCPVCRTAVRNPPLLSAAPLSILITASELAGANGDPFTALTEQLQCSQLQPVTRKCTQCFRTAQFENVPYSSINEARIRRIHTACACACTLHACCMHCTSIVHARCVHCMCVHVHGAARAWSCTCMELRTLCVHCKCTTSAPPHRARGQRSFSST